MTMSHQEVMRSSTVSCETLYLDAHHYAEESRPSPADVEYPAVSPAPTPMAFVALDDHHRLSEPILIEVTKDDDGVTVTDKLVSRFGEGATVAEALSDYASDVLDYFTMLRERRGRLSPRLARHLRVLEDRILEV